MKKRAILVRKVTIGEVSAKPVGKESRFGACAQPFAVTRHGASGIETGNRELVPSFVSASSSSRDTSA
jgi:hypothetical protein